MWQLPRTAKLSDLAWVQTQLQIPWTPVNMFEYVAGINPDCTQAGCANSETLVATVMKYINSQYGSKGFQWLLVESSFTIYANLAVQTVEQLILISFNLRPF